MFRLRRFAALLFGLVPLLAQAQTTSSGLFTPSAGDQSVSLFLNPLFGSLAGGSGTGGTMAALLTNFNSAAMFLGGLIVAYVLVAGTMATAHDGEMLGRQWSSLWTPIRTIVGTAFVMPVMPGGYCIAQAIVLWCALQGVGLADKLTTTFVANSLTATMTPMTQSDQAVRGFLGEVLVDLTCSEAIAQERGLIAADENGAAVIKTLGIATASAASSSTSNAGGVTYLFYPAKDDPSVGACGFATLSPSVVAAAAPTATAGSGGANLFDFTAISTAVSTAQQAQFSSDVTGLDALAKQIASGTPMSSVQSSVNSQLSSMSTAWLNATTQAAQGAAGASSNSPMVSAIEQDGWLMLGGWYMSIARGQQAMNEAVSSVPSVGKPMFTPSATSSDDHWYSGLFTSNGNADAMEATGVEFTSEDAAEVSTAQRAVSAAPAANGAPDLEAKNAAPTSALDRALAWAIGSATSWNVTSGTGATQQNPVITAEAIGSKLMNTGTVGMGGTMVAAAVLNTEVLGVGSPGTGTVLSQTLLPLWLMMVTTGGVLSFFVPLIPLTLWLGGAIGWLALLVEAMVAAPLWMVAHLVPGGDGLTGAGRRGYLLLLGMTIRPALMVLGFAAATAIMTPVGTLLNTVFLGAFLSSIHPSLFGVFSFLGGLVMYTLILQHLVRRVFSLIIEVPDHAMNWLGEHAGDRMGSHANALTGAVGGAAAGALAGGMALRSLEGGAAAMGRMQAKSPSKSADVPPPQGDSKGPTPSPSSTSTAAARDAGTSLTEAREAAQAAATTTSASAERGGGSASGPLAPAAQSVPMDSTGAPDFHALHDSHRALSAASRTGNPEAIRAHATWGDQTSATLRDWASAHASDRPQDAARASAEAATLDKVMEPVVARMDAADAQENGAEPQG